MISELSELQVSSSKPGNSENLRKWFSLVDAVSLSRRRALLPVEKLRNSLIANSKLHKTLYGFIVFEVAWSDVRGINYLNELQVYTDPRFIYVLYFKGLKTGFHIFKSFYHPAD